jgi:methionyl-tRNA formyltransferase
LALQKSGLPRFLSNRALHQAMTIDASRRVVAMVCDGLYQQHFVHGLSAAFNVVGIVVYRPETPKGGLLHRIRRLLGWGAAMKFLRSRRALRAELAAAAPLVEQLFHREGRGFECPPEAAQLIVSNINDPAVVEFLQQHEPHVVCINGTNLLREPLLRIASNIPYGFVNLHTGLSPYARGGNCDLFMLLEGRPEFVGITIHHIDAGIDSGDIIITARPDLSPDDNYAMIEAKSFHLGNRMMVLAVTQLFAGAAKRVKQWQGGKEFLRRTGYVYDPYVRLQVNRSLRDGLVARYLAEKADRDAEIQLVGPDL